MTNNTNTEWYSFLVDGKNITLYEIDDFFHPHDDSDIILCGDPETHEMNIVGFSDCTPAAVAVALIAYIGITDEWHFTYGNIENLQHAIRAVILSAAAPAGENPTHREILSEFCNVNLAEKLKEEQQ